MAKLIGLVGKPNCGKSTFFSASTTADAEIASYPFTTIEANRGIGYVRIDCACKEFDVDCDPKNSFCMDGQRFVPVELMDVAGLVPGAHEGKGLGNQFLDDLRKADALIHIVDAAGATNAEGEPCKPGNYDPRKDVKFLEKEIDQWFSSLLKKNWRKINKEIQMAKKEVVKELTEKFSGLGIGEYQISKAIKEADLDLENHEDWSDSDLERFATELRKISKPILICANKCDIDEAAQNIEKLKEENQTIPTSADSELALRRALDEDLIEYIPGDSDFEIVGDLSEEQEKGLEVVKEKVLSEFGSTGVQKTLNSAALDLLDLIAVFPVEDENKLTDKDGNILPDTYLVEKGTTVQELAYKVHSDIGENFICGVDAKTGRKLGADHELNHGDVVSIQYEK